MPPYRRAGSRNALCHMLLKLLPMNIAWEPARQNSQVLISRRGVRVLRGHANLLPPLWTRSGEAAARGAARPAVVRPSGPLPQHHDRRGGPRRVLRQVRKRRLAQPALPCCDDGLRSLLRRLQFAQDQTSAARRPCSPDVGGGQLSVLPHPLLLCDHLVGPHQLLQSENGGTATVSCLAPARIHTFGQKLPVAMVCCVASNVST